MSARLTGNVQNSRAESGKVRHDGTSDVRRAQDLRPSNLLLEEDRDKRISLGVGVEVDWIALDTRLDELRYISRDRDRRNGLSHDTVRLRCRADRRERCVWIGDGEARAGRWDGLDVKRGCRQVVELGADANTNRFCRANSADVFCVDRTRTTRHERRHVQ